MCPCLLGIVPIACQYVPEHAWCAAQPLAASEDDLVGDASERVGELACDPFLGVYKGTIVIAAWHAYHDTP